MPQEQPDALYLLEDDEFVEVSDAWGITDTGSSRGLMLADINNDGWLDIVKQYLRFGRPFLYLSRCGEEAWLRVELRQEGPNPRAVGARAKFTAGDISTVRWVHAGGTSIASGGPNELHVGLGMEETVFVDVTWPDGEVTRHGPIDTRQRIRTRPEPAGRGPERRLNQGQRLVSAEATIWTCSTTDPQLCPAHPATSVMVTLRSSTIPSTSHGICDVGIPSSSITAGTP